MYTNAYRMTRKKLVGKIDEIGRTFTHRHIVQARVLAFFDKTYTLIYL